MKNTLHADRTLQTQRHIPFSPSAVYAAFTQPEALAIWWGPKGFTNTFDIFECHEGGRWQFSMHGPDGHTYKNDSVLLTLEPEKTWVVEHQSAPHFILTVNFKAEEEGTHVEWIQVFDDAQVADAVRKIAGPANEENLDRLTHYLATRE